MTHHATVTRRGSGYGFRCTCGEEPHRSTKQRRIAEGWAKLHEAGHEQDNPRAEPRSRPDFNPRVDYPERYGDMSEISVEDLDLGTFKNLPSGGGAS